jgi:hypothetical protein
MCEFVLLFVTMLNDNWFVVDLLSLLIFTPTDNSNLWNLLALNLLHAWRILQPAQEEKYASLLCVWHLFLLHMEFLSLGNGLFIIKHTCISSILLIVLPSCCLAFASVRNISLIIIIMEELFSSSPL